MSVYVPFLWEKTASKELGSQVPKPTPRRWVGGQMSWKSGYESILVSDARRYGSVINVWISAVLRIPLVHLKFELTTHVQHLDRLKVTRVQKVTLATFKLSQHSTRMVNLNMRCANRILRQAELRICLTPHHWWPFLSCRNLESLKPTFRGKGPLPDFWSRAGNLSSLEGVQQLRPRSD